MHPGKEIRLQKIWKHRCAVVIPFDHAEYSGGTSGVDDVRRLTERIASTDADGILITPGTLKQVASLVGDLGIILRIDGGFTKYARGPADYGTLCPIPEAVRLGADAAIVFTFVGTPNEHESLIRLGRTASEADAWGLPLVAEILPPSLLNNHFGSDVFPPPSRGVDIAAQTLDAARLGAEAGADVIKTRFTGDPKAFREIVDKCGIPVLVAGGPLLRRRGTNTSLEESVLQLAAESVQGGAKGIMFGRNVWLHPKMERLIAALCAIVHEGESVKNAWKLLR
jgi:fructose-bisphosphate aldolase/2-amino-3,7-dideoxy-D-threo-hept-6-ulosonate synthase